MNWAGRIVCLLLLPFAVVWLLGMVGFGITWALVGTALDYLEK